MRCPICKRKFSQRSLAFHVSACVRAKSGSWEEHQCPLCHESVRGDMFKCHLTTNCLYRHIPEGAGERNGSDIQHGRNERVPFHQLASVKNAKGEENYHGEAAMELLKCDFCSRKFAKGDRFNTHVAICKRKMNTPKRDTYDSRSKRAANPRGGCNDPVSSGWGSMPRMSASFGGNTGGYLSRAHAKTSHRMTSTISSEARFHQPSKSKVSIGESNTASMGNPLAISRRIAPRPTYSHF